MLNGKKIAITGILSSYKRADAFTALSERGGIPQSSVTRETDILVVGYYRNNIPCFKSKKRITAERYKSMGYNILIIDENEFLSMLWTSSLSYV